MSIGINRQINHKAMRVIVGVIAVLLSPVSWFLSNQPGLNSISESYWTDSRDIFVGSLVAVGFFLSAYNGKGGRDREYYLSKFACVFAIIVALFPTHSGDATNVPPTWVQSIASTFGVTPGMIHYGAAIFLFVCLVFLMWFFSTRAKKDYSDNLRAYLYRAIAITMVTGMIIIYFSVEAMDRDDAVFWVEYWGLTFFGLGWLLAGTYRDT